MVGDFKSDGGGTGASLVYLTRRAPSSIAHTRTLVGSSHLVHSELRSFYCHGVSRLIEAGAS
jgi:hypothetical protein